MNIIHNGKVYNFKLNIELDTIKKIKEYENRVQESLNFAKIHNNSSEYKHISKMNQLN